MLEVIIPLMLTAKELTLQHTDDIQLVAVDFCDKLARYPHLIKIVSRHPVMCLSDANTKAQLESTCFRNGVAVGVSDQLSVGLHDVPTLEKHFPDWRREFYQRLDLNITGTRSPPGRFSLGLIVRKNNRKLLNADHVLAHLRSTFPQLDAFELDFARSDNYSDAVSRVRSLDLLLGVHGAGLTNALFLRPGATLIQLFPYHENHYPMGIGHEFARLARMAGAFYLGHYEASLSDSTLLQHAPKKEHGKLRDPNSSGVNLHVLHEQDITVPPEQVAKLVGTAIGWIGGADPQREIDER